VLIRKLGGAPQERVVGDPFIPLSDATGKQRFVAFFPIRETPVNNEVSSHAAMQRKKKKGRKLACSAEKKSGY
jgi:hypothetical protein